MESADEGPFTFRCPDCGARLHPIHEGPPDRDQVVRQVILWCVVCGRRNDPSVLLWEELDRRAARGEPVHPLPSDLLPWAPKRHPIQDLSGRALLDAIRPPMPPAPTPLPDFSSWSVAFRPPPSPPLIPPIIVRGPRCELAPPGLTGLDRPCAPFPFRGLALVVEALERERARDRERDRALIAVGVWVGIVVWVVEDFVPEVCGVVEAIAQAMTPGPTQAAASPSEDTVETSTREPKPRPPRQARRGRPPGPVCDPARDRQIFEAWETKLHRTKEDLARALGETEVEVRYAIDRERKRRQKASE